MESFKDREQMTILAFLMDKFIYLDGLNLTLLGKNKTLADCRKAITAFQAKISLFNADLYS